jgi:hypothetical protein
MKHLTTTLIILTIATTAFGQTYETKNYIRIPANVEVTKTEKAKNCDELIKAGSVVSSELKKKNGDYDVTITKTDTLKTDTIIPFDKEVKIKFKSLPGKANLSVNEKENSILQVNYWLNPTYTITKGTSFRVIKNKFNCDGTVSIEKEDAAKRELSVDTTVVLWKANEADKNEEWFKASNVVIEVYKDNRIEYYFVNKFDRNGSYTIKLDNREYVSYNKRGFEFGAVTIPFKYRFGETKTVNGKEIKVNNEFIADANLGLFAGYKLAKYRVRYEGGKLKDLSNLGCTLGAFLNVSSSSIDSLSTTLSDAPLKKDEKFSIGVISPGLGAMFTVYNVQIGGFIGWDFGFGENGEKWNFNGRPWIGFGLGYSLSSFWKK